MCWLYDLFRAIPHWVAWAQVVTRRMLSSVKSVGMAQSVSPRKTRETGASIAGQPSPSHQTTATPLDEREGGIPTPNPISAGISTHDALRRREYESKIRERSRAARAAVQRAHSQGRAVEAWEAARESSDTRARTRGEMQRRVSPGARRVSEVIDTSKNFDDYARKYSIHRPSAMGGGKAPTRYAYEIAERVAIGSGSTNRAVSVLARATRVLGPVGVAIGTIASGATIYNAPEGQRGRVAAGEAGALIYGALGFQLGMAAGASVAAFVTSFLVAAGLASGPIGWLVLGISIGVGLLGAWAFGRLGQSVGSGVYDITN
jgi:stage V sporulation protein SpoVS